jgi:hypothetical protein
VIGGLTEHFHSDPTYYSHGMTTDTDAPKIRHRLVADVADAALLMPL